MALTRITSDEISTGAITADKIAASVSLGGPKITTVNVANSAYTVLDDTAVNVGGGYIVITGSGFESGAQVIIDTTTATSVSYINSSTLRAEVPSKSAASYNLYVVNPDGGTAIKVNGVTYSGVPTWVTASPLSNQQANVSFNVALSATGATSYSNTTSLPAGTQLLSNGYFYGTVTIGVETQYTFTVRATDAELQDADKSFQVTVTVTPLYQLWSWGTNAQGRLGLNNTVYRSSPIQVGTSTDWSYLSSSRYETFAIKNDGTLWTWGNNSHGQLGLNNGISISSPVQVGNNTNWRNISVKAAPLAIKTDGTIWTWGEGFYGSLGLNESGSYARRSSPVQIGTSTDWSVIGGDFNSSYAIKTNGTLWAWGYNNNGQLCLNDLINRSSPVQIGSATNWSKIEFSDLPNQVSFINTNGNLFLCGKGNYGQLGQNDIVDRSSPVQVGTGTNWNSAYMGYGFVVANKTDGTLWTWGNNGSGQLGLGDVILRSSPVQVGSSTSWKGNTFSTGEFCIALKQV